MVRRNVIHSTAFIDRQIIRFTELESNNLFITDLEVFL
jgi:hypothetical protein